jgi:hypothetical protein
MRDGQGVRQDDHGDGGGVGGGTMKDCASFGGRFVGFGAVLREIRSIWCDIGIFFFFEFCEF